MWGVCSLYLWHWGFLTSFHVVPNFSCDRLKLLQGPHLYLQQRDSSLGAMCWRAPIYWQGNPLQFWQGGS